MTPVMSFFRSVATVCGSTSMATLTAMTSGWMPTPLTSTLQAGVRAQGINCTLPKVRYGNTDTITFTVCVCVYPSKEIISESHLVFFYLVLMSLFFVKCLINVNDTNDYKMHLGFNWFILASYLSESCSYFSGSQTYLATPPTLIYKGNVFLSLFVVRKNYRTLQTAITFFFISGTASCQLTQPQGCPYYRISAVLYQKSLYSIVYSIRHIYPQFIPKCLIKHILYCFYKFDFNKLFLFPFFLQVAKRRSSPGPTTWKWLKHKSLPKNCLPVLAR